MVKSLDNICIYALKWILSRYDNIIYEDAEDIVSDAKLAYLKTIDKGRTISKPHQYFKGICKHLISQKKYAAVKKNNIIKFIRTQYEIAYDTLSNNIYHGYNLREIKTFVPHKYHKLLDALADSKTIKEAADKTGINIQTAYSRVQYIRSKVEIQFLYDRGYVISNKLLDENQNTYVRKFLRDYNNACQEGQIEILNKHIPAEIADSIDFDYDIYKIDNISYHLYSPGKFKAMVIYKSQDDSVNYLDFKFEFVDGRLQLITPLRKPAGFRKLSEDEKKKLKNKIHVSQDKKQPYSKFEQDEIKKML